MSIQYYKSGSSGYDSLLPGAFQTLRDVAAQRALDAMVRFLSKFSLTNCGQNLFGSRIVENLLNRSNQWVYGQRILQCIEALELSGIESTTDLGALAGLISRQMNVQMTAEEMSDLSECLNSMAEGAQGVFTPAHKREIKEKLLKMRSELPAPTYPVDLLAEDVLAKRDALSKGAALANLNCPLTPAAIAEVVRRGGAVPPNSVNPVGALLSAALKTSTFVSACIGFRAAAARAAELPALRPVMKAVNDLGSKVKEKTGLDVKDIATRSLAALTPFQKKALAILGIATVALYAFRKNMQAAPGAAVPAAPALAVVAPTPQNVFLQERNAVEELYNQLGTNVQTSFAQTEGRIARLRTNQDGAQRLANSLAKEDYQKIRRIREATQTRTSGFHDSVHCHLEGDPIYGTYFLIQSQDGSSLPKGIRKTHLTRSFNDNMSADGGAYLGFVDPRVAGGMVRQPANQQEREKSLLFCKIHANWIEEMFSVTNPQFSPQSRFTVKHGFGLLNPHHQSEKTEDQLRLEATESVDRKRTGALLREHSIRLMEYLIKKSVSNYRFDLTPDELEKRIAFLDSVDASGLCKSDANYIKMKALFDSLRAQIISQCADRQARATVAKAVGHQRDDLFGKTPEMQQAVGGILLAVQELKNVMTQYIPDLAREGSDLAGNLLGRDFYNMQTYATNISAIIERYIKRSIGAKKDLSSLPEREQILILSAVVKECAQYLPKLYKRALVTKLNLQHPILRQKAMKLFSINESQIELAIQQIDHHLSEIEKSYIELVRKIGYDAKASEVQIALQSATKRFAEQRIAANQAFAQSLSEKLELSTLEKVKRFFR